MSDTIALPTGYCESLTNKNNFSATIRIYYTFEITTIFSTTEMECGILKSRKQHVVRGTYPAPDFTFELKFTKNSVFLAPAGGNYTLKNLNQYKNRWADFNIKLNEAKNKLEKPEEEIEAKEKEIICSPEQCDPFSGKIPAQKGTIKISTTKKVEVQAVLVNVSIVSPLASCSID